MVFRSRTMIAAVALTTAALAASPSTAEAREEAPPIPEASMTVPGADDMNCIPSPEHPRPVVLVHGTWSNAEATWSDLAPQLREQGYCVFAMDYGQREGLDPNNLLNLWGGADIARSAGDLAAFVDVVRARTGADRVDIVGHSQGGILARQYLKFNGGADVLNPSRNAVKNVVTLGATNHGTTYDDKQFWGKLAELVGIPVVDVAAAAVGPSAVQQMVGSPFLQILNAGGDTLPGIDYTVIASRDDTVSTPPANTFLAAGPGATVDNVWVQDVCPDSTIDHMALASADPMPWLIMRGLDDAGTPPSPVSCSAPD